MKNPDSVVPLFCENVTAWRAWLATNGSSENEVWLTYFKKGFDVPCVSYDESLEEALCFGWIDGLMRSVDEARYMRRFTPRKQASRWSQRNIAIMERLIADGRATEAAITEYRAALDAGRLVEQPEKPELSDDLQRELKADRDVYDQFQALPPSHRREFILWIMDAKRNETRHRRLEKAKSMIRERRRVGM